MCGIFTAFNYSKKALNIENCIKAIEKVKHRGPDHIGYESDERCFLGHTRLSIIGLQESGNQPFYFEYLKMIYNGEIFNYIELRSELECHGYHFDTDSDTEVVIKSFHKWGEQCFSHFNGMWSLVIYDTHSKEIYVSRDRFGQKPLFYMQSDDVLYFASEIQQLTMQKQLAVDYFMIQSFLKEGDADLGGRTFFKDIKTFPKSEYWKVKSDGSIEKNSYWKYFDGAIAETNDKVFDEFEHLFEDSVKLRLRADVPLSVLLSGGIDSTLVAYYMRKENTNEKILAFTYASEDHNDESQYAQIIANQLKMSLVISKQDNNPDDYILRLKRLVQHLGKGHSSPAIVSIDYLYEKIASSNIKVSLDGQGADELLGGYKTYFLVLLPYYLKSMQFKQAYLLTKDMIKDGFLSSLKLSLRTNLSEPSKKFLRKFIGYEKFFSDFKDSEKTLLEEDSVAPNKRTDINGYLMQQHSKGLSNLLYYGDIVAMNNSVENRSPFMDHRLVDFVFKYGDKLKIWNAKNKYVLRKLTGYQVFRQQLERKKIGFSSNIKLETKKKMVLDLETSPIFDWPIFSKNVKTYVNSTTLLMPKYERFMFRLYQVHLWNEIFYSNIEHDCI